MEGSLGVTGMIGGRRSWRNHEGHLGSEVMEGSLGVMGHWGYGGSEVIERLWGSFGVRGQGGVMEGSLGVTGVIGVRGHGGIMRVIWGQRSRRGHWESWVIGVMGVQRS